jgi:hypothetical protein
MLCLGLSYQEKTGGTSSVLQLNSPVDTACVCQDIKAKSIKRKVEVRWKREEENMKRGRELGLIRNCR